MKIQILKLNVSPWTTTTAVAVLRVLHRWSKRHYHRALLRRELRCIGREMGDTEGRRQSEEVRRPKAGGGDAKVKMAEGSGRSAEHPTSRNQDRMSRR